MNIEQLREYCIAKQAVTEEFPFDDKTLVFKVMGKMFALIGLERIPLQVNLKCDLERSAELRETYNGLIYGAYHMSKLHWNTVEVTQLPPKLVLELIDHSYEMVAKGLPKKLRDSLL